MVRAVAVVFGTVYLAVGLIGFALTGLDGEATLVIFGVNPLHNVIHIVLGVAALASCRSEKLAGTVLVVLGGVLGLVTVLGFLNLLGLLGMRHGIADPDNFLHLVTGAAALVTGQLYAPAEHPQDEELAA